MQVRARPQALAPVASARALACRVGTVLVHDCATKRRVLGSNHGVAFVCAVAFVSVGVTDKFASKSSNLLRKPMRRSSNTFAGPYNGHDWLQLPHELMFVDV